MTHLDQIIKYGIKNDCDLDPIFDLWNSDPILCIDKYLRAVHYDKQLVKDVEGLMGLLKNFPPRKPKR